MENDFSSGRPRGPLWTREETMIAFNLYSKMQYGQIHDYHPEIVDLAEKINRPPASLSLKMCNLASQDPKRIDRRGTRIAKMETAVWKEFRANPGKFMLESEKLYLAAMGESLLATMEKSPDNVLEPEVAYWLEGRTRDRLVSTRVNQSSFRRMILSAYDNRCCITGIAVPELLNASHIKPWWKDSENRINPHNGLCLNALHDRAFDRGLISVTPDLIVHVSPKLLESAAKSKKAATTSEKIQFIVEAEGASIAKPERFAPHQDFLEYHYRNIFQH